MHFRNSCLETKQHVGNLKHALAAPTTGLYTFKFGVFRTSYLWQLWDTILPRSRETGCESLFSQIQIQAVPTLMHMQSSISQPQNAGFCLNLAHGCNMYSWLKSISGQIQDGGRRRGAAPKLRPNRNFNMIFQLARRGARQKYTRSCVLGWKRAKCWFEFRSQSTLSRYRLDTDQHTGNSKYCLEVPIRIYIVSKVGKVRSTHPWELGATKYPPRKTGVQNLLNHQ